MKLIHIKKEALNNDKFTILILYWIIFYGAAMIAVGFILGVWYMMGRLF